ncbi:winged helix-turn-helix transcriptional regulator [Marinicella gelatinilytica]|uniref:winged helix-turn-helix transcriptional regulator n=1 Tax=Marinicella gelatinilytica TaxID=2996017 RepID=UPI002260BB30|nr:winged helix-turn-helix transcriptional regulator [Marinicella gelatinilytica]MCX7543971.1 tetratricopeptide repeat protein [Marinicella gelatinilytica]
MTKKTYDLLLFLVKNPQKVHSKETLIEQVWHGRAVSGNTIDQTISKLRKILSDYTDQSLIESIYGQGIKWTEPVCQQASQQKRFNKFPKIAGILIILVAIVLSLWWWQSKQAANTSQQPTTLLFQLSAEEGDVVLASAGQFLRQLLTYSGDTTVKSIDDRPKFVLSDDFVVNQQKLIPDLTIIKIKPLSKQDDMAWLIEVLQSGQLLLEAQVSADSFQTLLSKSAEVLIDQLNLSSATIDGLLPDQDFVMDLYVRGLQSLAANDLNKAKQQFQLAVNEQTNFYLARLKLAETLNQLGNNEAAFSGLDTLMQLNAPDGLKVAASTLKMRILKVKGEYAQAADIYQQLVDSNRKAPADIWYAATYEYAAIVQYLNKPQEALNIYNRFIDEALLTEDVALLAAVRASKASLLQQQGDVEGAIYESEQALHLHELNKDAVGVARTYSVLARIANQKANYKLAEQYLRQALTITESVGHKLGEGAVLNELIYALMLQGKHKEAWELNNRVLAIGTDLAYSGMLMAAYQAFYEMSRIQSDWGAATRWLNSYQQLAEDIHDQRRLAKAELFRINLLLDQDMTSEVSNKISLVQSHIDHADELLMQPALEVFRGRYQWLLGQKNEAIRTLLKAKELAAELADFESIINANNYLATFYLQQNKPQQALNILAESEMHQPFAIPYLRIKAQAQFLHSQPIKALETLMACQQQAPEIWGLEEQTLLETVKKAIN